MANVSQWKRLKAIIWKNYLIRKYHWFWTLLEFLVPIGLVLPVIYLRAHFSQLKREYISHATYLPLQSAKDLYNSFKHEVYYTPNTNFTKKLMHNVQKLLRLNDTKMQSFENEQDLIAEYKYLAKNKSVFGVVFNKAGEDVSRFRYVIRPLMKKVVWNTEYIFDPMSLSYKPGEGSKTYIETGFIALQIALDVSYIKVITHLTLPMNLFVQEFPHPPYLQDTGLLLLFNYVLPSMTYLSFCLLFPIFINYIMNEKTTGIKELMKTLGIRSWMIWLTWFLHEMVLHFVSVTVIAFLVKINIFGIQHPLIEYSTWSMLVVFYTLYHITATTYCLFISSISDKSSTATSIAVTSWILPGIAFANIVNSHHTSYPLKIFLALLFPNLAFDMGYKQLVQYEVRERGIDLYNIFETATGRWYQFSMGTVLVLFVISSIIFTLLTFYFENILPGPYGVPKPLNFPIAYFAGKRRRNSSVIDVEDEETEVVHDRDIEVAPNFEVGIKIRGLCKNYGTFKAVNNFSIDIYESQITAMLGHNGAGKTSILNIITGMSKATKGEIVIGGLDIKNHLNTVLSKIGYCPQHNMYFADLTVLQHLVFFGLARGLSNKEAQTKAKMLINRLQLQKKKNSIPSMLSMGMQRKLVLGMAVIGDSKVLILDEPSAGLDPEARREIWNILQTFRGNRTIIITTHLMDEAEVLGDRIAIIDHGKLVCYGTSIYLKEQYGTGYNLKITCDEKYLSDSKSMPPNQLQSITRAVRKKVRNASLISVNKGCVRYLLPFDMKPLFGDLLEELDTNKENLHITNISLSFTTLDDVYLNVGGRAAEDKAELNARTANVQPYAHKKRRGLTLIFLQLMSLFWKRWIFLKRKWHVYMTAMIMAELITLLVLYLGEISPSTVETNFEFILQNYGETTVCYGGESDNEFMIELQHRYRRLVKSARSSPWNVTNVSEGLLRKASENIAFYKDFMVIAAEFNASHTALNAMYSNPAAHGAPISVNMLMNALLKQLADDDSRHISASNAPLTTIHEREYLAVSSTKVILVWVFLFPLGIYLLIGTFFVFPLLEHSTKVKQLQLMCGVTPVRYWMVCYMVDLVIYMIGTFIILLTIEMYILSGSKFFKGSDELAVLAQILIAYGLSAIPHVYLYSYAGTVSGAFSCYFGATISIVLLFVVVLMLLGVVMDVDLEIAHNIMILYPQFAILQKMGRFIDKILWNYNWDLLSEKNKASFCTDSPNPCCGNPNGRDCIEYRSYYYNYMGRSIYWPLAIIALSGVIYFTILLLLDTNFTKKMWEKLLDLFRDLNVKKEFDEESGGDDVEMEADRIADILKEEKKDANLRRSEEHSAPEDILLVHELHKAYLQTIAVQDVSFAVKPGECFGLLGVNGAGKTTTLRLLTGDIPLLFGEARVATPAGKRIYLSTQSVQYLKEVGYCPQWDALNETLTGREMLHVFAMMRGIVKGIDEEVNMWLSALDLQEYADKKCGHYSGGNKRKLTIAVALIGDSILIMMDEPTAGVDPVSRRRLWNIVPQLQEQNNTSLILTSHSMEECEALCGKLAIMKAGRLKCYGTLPEIKTKYAQGYSVILKLKQAPVSSNRVLATFEESPSGRRLSRRLTAEDEKSEDIQKLLAAFEEEYRGIYTLKDKYVGVLNYHINDKNKKWGQIYKEMEQLQQNHPIIEDYYISETTLEEVFLLIARSD